jgi:hypothetical protein
MSRLVINNSPNIAVLESKIVSDLCLGKFFVDLTPTLYKSLTANQDVLGAKVKITNPYGFPVKDYGIGYDILPPMDSIFSFDIPTQSNNFQWGTFIVSIEITDANGDKYEITENTTICQPNPKDKRVRYGNLYGKIKGLCKVGKVLIQVDEPPTYQGVAAESKTQEYTLNYPAGTIAIPLVSIQPSFETVLYEGIYKLQGDVCATYNYGNHNFVKVPYKVLVDKNIMCLVDECAVASFMLNLTKELRTDSCKDKENLSNVLLSVVTELETIRIATECGEDVSDNIKKLYEIIGIECIVGNLGTPVGAIGTPASSIVLDGCNVSTSVSGLTTRYTIDNFAYEIQIDPSNSSFLVVSPPVLGGCTKVQTLTFDVSALYTQIKGVVENTNDNVFWADIVKGGFIPTAPNLAFLGLTAPQYAALDYSGFWNVVIAKMATCCGGSICSAIISNLTEVANGQLTTLSWINEIDAFGNTGVFSLEIYVDAQLVDTVLLSALITGYSNLGVEATYNLTGYNDGATHIVRVFARCQNGASGNDITLNFSNAGCPAILPPSLSSNSVPNASCPFDLNTLVQGAIPVGLSIEWHNQNNTNPSSVVGNSTSVTSGTYYAFYSDANKCNSPASIVTIVCQQAGNCSEPLNVLVMASAGNTNIITFSPAITSPPSYLVKRRLFIDSDVPGSYTTIGVPLYNAGTNKYEITDVSAALNMLYVYREESQCGDGSRPFSDFQFASITCPVLSTIPTDTTIPFSFFGVGGQVDKYAVELYDNTGLTLINTIIITPAFTSPIVGTFTGLSAGINYKIRVVAFIGLVRKECNLENVMTTV